MDLLPFYHHYSNTSVYSLRERIQDGMIFIAHLISRTIAYETFRHYHQQD